MMNWKMSSVRPERRARRGFTMVELMVVIAIVAIGTMLVLPDLSQFMRRNRVQSATNEVISAISRARVEAARTGASAGGAGIPYTVCASNNSEVNDVAATPAPACTGATPEAWRDGAIVFADTNGDGDRDINEALVLSIPPAPANVTVALNSLPSSGPVLPYILYAPNGKLHGSVMLARFTVSTDGFPITQGRFVCLERTGRAAELSYANLKSDSRYAACAAISPAVP